MKERFYEQADAVIDNPKRLSKLLRLEKERRGLSQDKLVFVGMHNLAQYWWCAMYSLYKSRDNELGFFRSYLQDRLKYSYYLGVIDSLPTRDEGILDVGNSLNLKDVEKNLQDQEKEFLEKVFDGEASVTSIAQTYEDGEGNKTAIISSELPDQDRESLEKWLTKEGFQIISPEEDPKMRGMLLESERSERYPTIRWNFRWKNYVVVGVPEGITKDFVYEFKTTGMKDLWKSFVKPVAMTQADLYGYFFKRPQKRVQVYSTKEDETVTFHEDVDAKRAQQTLENFRKMEEGKLPLPPKPFKCKNCEYLPICPITPLKNSQKAARS